jgi:hypothetical protein
MLTFNSRQRMVWLDHLGRSPAAAGHLCLRHADALVAPRGWTLEDRRVVAPVVGDAAAPARADHPPAGEGGAPDLLDAQTPLLARAFRAARAS